MPVAVIQLIITTPAQPDVAPKAVADNLRTNADLAYKRAAVIDTLAERNWAMLQPIVRGDGGAPTPGDITDYQDIVIFFAKPFADSDEAEVEAEVCGCRERLNFSFLWDWDGTFDDSGWPNFEWGGECR